MRRILPALLSPLSLIVLQLVIAACGSEPPASIRGQVTREKLSDLYSQAERYTTTWPDSLLVVAEKISQQGSSTGDRIAIIRGQRYRAQALWRKGNHKEAMKVAIEALADAEKWNATAELPDIYAVIGNLHKEKANYNMALSAADKGMSAARSVHDTASIIYLARVKAMFTQGLGADRKDTSLIRKSLDMHLEGLKLAEISPKFERQRIGYYNNIAQVYVKRRELDKALFFVSKGIRLAKKYNQLLSLTYSYTWLSQIYLLNGNKNKALEYLREGLRIARDLKNPFREMELNDYLYEALVTTKDYEQALAAYTRYSEIRDSIRVLENVRQIGELQVQYEAEKKDQQISNLGAMNEAKTRETIWALVGLGIFLLLSLFMLIQYRIIARSNRILETNGRKLHEQSEKMKVLMKELHHRVKNNLQTVSSLLSLQSNRISDEDARESIRTGQQRIEAMSLIHKSLYSQDNVNLVDMREYMANLVESVMHSFGVDEGKMKLNINVNVLQLDIDLATPLGLIVNEWVTNSFKHAYTHVKDPELSVTLEKRDCLYLEINDNGPGMDLSIWNRPGKSFGIKLVKVLSRQVDGQCDVTIEDGTRFSLEIPLPQFKQAS